MAAMNSADSFGYWVRRRRKALDLTQEALAQRAGCAAVTLRKIEADERRPSAQMAQRLAQCLALTVTESSLFVAAALRERAPARLPLSVEHAGKPHVNLSAPVTSLVGRSVELAAITDRLRTPEVRFLTLTGPVGVGKTRLAVEAGRRMLAEFRDGACLVALAALQDPALVPSAAATVLGVREVRNRNLSQSVIDFLASKEMLLIFDNFEHLLPAVPFLSALLAKCPGLHLLVTSRARLHLYGEHEFVVAPLEVPDGLEPADAAGAPAVRLFCLRAQAARADFRLTPALAPVIAEMCRRLDGLPLAIELAAARIKLFSVQELQERLEHRLPLLTQVAAGLPPRLQGLEGAIAWSYGLLAPFERALLRRLAVFAGGISFAAVERVCRFPVVVQTPPSGDTAAALTVEDIIGGIEALLDQSLLQRAAPQTSERVGGRGCCGACPKRLLGTAIQSESRFTMLETIREFALKQLQANAELSTAQRRHAEYFASWAEQAAEHLHGPEQAIWLARLEDQLGNLRAALAWLLDAGEIDLAARLACALGIFWQRHGHYSEGREWLQQVLGQMTYFPTPPILRARTLQVAAMLAYRKGDPLIAERWLVESLGLFNGVSDQAGLARVLFDLGWIAIDRSDWTAAIDLNRQSLAVARASNDLCAMYRALTNLGWTHLSMDEKRTAALLFEEAHALAQRIGHTNGVAVSLANLSWIALRQGELARCVSLAQESLRLCHLLGEREVLAENLEILAAAATVEGDDFRANQLSGGAEAVWGMLQVTRLPLPFLGSGRGPRVDTVAPTVTGVACPPARRQDGVPWLDALVAAALGCEETDG